MYVCRIGIGSKNIYFEKFRIGSNVFDDTPCTVLEEGDLQCKVYRSISYTIWFFAWLLPNKLCYVCFVFVRWIVQFYPFLPVWMIFPSCTPYLILGMINVLRILTHIFSTKIIIIFFVASEKMRLSFRISII